MAKAPRFSVRQGDLTKAARGVRAAGIESFDLVCGPEGLIIRVMGDAPNGADAEVAAELRKWSGRG